MERNRFNCFEVEVDLGGGDWLRRVVVEAIRLGQDGNFRRLFRCRNYQLIVDSSKNRVGCCRFKMEQVW